MSADASAPKREPVDLLADEIESFLSPYRCSYHTTLVKILAPYAASLDEIEDLRGLLAQAGAVVKLTAKDWGLTHPDGSTARLEGVDQLLEQIDAALRGEPKEGM